MNQSQKSLFQLRQVDFLIKKSWKLISEENWPKALACCDRAIEYYSQHFMAWHTKGYILHAMERYSEALEAYNQALTLEPNNSDTLFEQADTAHKLGRCTQAIAIYDKLAANPAHKERALLCKIEVLRFVRRYSPALDICEQLLATNPDNIDALLKKGHLMDEMGNKAEALEIYDRILSNDRILSESPDHFMVVSTLKSLILEDLGRTEEAMQLREIVHQFVLDSIDKTD